MRVRAHRVAFDAICTPTSILPLRRRAVLARRVSGAARLCTAERLVHRGRRNDIHDTTFFTSIRKDGEDLPSPAPGCGSKPTVSPKKGLKIRFVMNLTEGKAARSAGGIEAQGYEERADASSDLRMWLPVGRRRTAGSGSQALSVSPCLLDRRFLLGAHGEVIKSTAGLGDLILPEQCGS
jgi:hypothetical protein